MLSGHVTAGPSHQQVTSADACLSIVHSLMSHRQSNEDEGFAKRAIEGLVKKLKDKRDELDALITSVTTQGAIPTKCVTIQRTLDGRLQVAGRKGFPHVVYTRIWRWPDLHKNELKHLKFCTYAFDLKQDAVCVNPYHYERVINSAIDLSNLTLSNSIDGITAEHTMDDQSDDSSIRRHHHSGGNSISRPNSYSALQLQGPSTSGGGSNGGTPNSALSPALSVGSSWPAVVTRPMMMGASPNLHPLTTAVPPDSSPSWRHVSPTSTNSFGLMRGNSYPPHTAPAVPSAGINPLLSVNPSQHLMPSNSYQLIKENPQMFLRSLPPLDYWCTVAYFEYDQAVGELFKVRSDCHVVTVDGYTDPSSPNRFCLGQLSNVHREDGSEKARLFIGKGIDLENRIYNSETNEFIGEVWLKCKSEHSIFVESYYLDREANRPPGDVVHKLYPQTMLKVFDTCQCYLQMHQITQMMRDSALHQNDSSSSTLPFSWPSVDDLKKLCTLRLSFVKGWGQDYPRRTIKETPCWVEIQLHRGLQLLDEFLQSMPLSESKMNHYEKPMPYYQGCYSNQ